MRHVRFLAMFIGSLATVHSAVVANGMKSAATSTGTVLKTEWVSVGIDLQNDGRVTVECPTGARIVAATAGVTVDGKAYVAAEFPEHAASDIEPHTSALGRGERITITHRGLDGLELRQVIDVYANQHAIFTTLDVRRTNGEPVATNHISPLLIDAGHSTITLGTTQITQVLSVPYDNDEYSRYDSTPAKEGPTRSSEVTALYNRASRHAIVIGSVTHDTWKTGIDSASPNAEGVVPGLRAFGGKSDSSTHDHEPHGTVSGTVVSSPTLFIGAFDDWRDGLNAYGKANASITPALQWTDGAPFGWNSWAAHKSELNLDSVQSAIDLVDALRERGFENDGTAYVNLDSFWDKLSDDQLKQLIDETHRRGLKFGLYWTPFCFWGDEASLSRTMDNTDGKYTFLDAALKGADGRPLPKHSGAFALDPTHPGTRARNAALYARFVALGVDFVKLDFLSHGALEGQHFDPDIQTGTQAYHVGMRDVLNAFDERKTGRPIFISLSIAPLFPHGYGHARRMTCDVFATLDATKYLLNGLTYSFWAHGTLYAFNDPDHTVVHHVHNETPVNEAVAAARLNASLIAGGMLLNSDDARDADSRARVMQLFTHPATLDLAKRARSFRPVDGDVGHDASAVYILDVGDARYLAVFNFDEKAAATLVVDLSKIGLKQDEAVIAVELGTDDVIASSNDGEIRFSLAPAESHVLRLVAKSADQARDR